MFILSPLPKKELIENINFDSLLCWLPTTTINVRGIKKLEVSCNFGELTENS